MQDRTDNKVIVDASKQSFSLGLKDLLKYKDLFFTLSYRDIKVRYAQTILGLFWAFIQPALTLVILIIVFDKFVKIDTGTIPYPLFAVAGVTVWTYFSFVLSQAGGSIIGAQEMIRKIYFPRLIVPLSKAVVGLVDFAVSLIILLVLFIVYKHMPSSNIIYLPLIIIALIITSLSVGILISALSIRYRDFQYIVPFAIQLGLYITPIAYPSEVALKNLPEWAAFIYYLNPISGIVELFRWSLFGGGVPSNFFWISMSMVLFLFFFSIFYFKKLENKMADII